MSDAATSGAAMPEGIEVDDAAAYFGVTESSASLHELMAMERTEAMKKFFSLLSDIVLRPGEFDFEAASERMQCEGGEIYFLVAGHLGLMSLPDQLLNFLGQPNSMGEGGGSAPSVSGGELDSLTKLSDPMHLMKLLAIGHATGGEDETARYLGNLEALLSNPGGNKDALVAIANELDAALDVAGHALPVASLASANASSAEVSAPANIPTPAAPEPVAAKPVEAESVSLPPTSSVPLPGASEPVSTVEPSVELPVTESVALPQTEIVEVEEELDVENEKEVAKATQDAFAGAFSVGMDEPQAAPEPVVEEQPEPVAEELPAVEPQPVSQAVEEPESEYVSAAEQFIAADGDDSGQLSVEELAQATGVSLEEAEEIHKQADTDGDGSVSFSEFMASPAAQKAAQLPRPVAPVRKPLGASQAGQEATAGQAPAQQNQQPQQQQGWNQQQPQQWGGQQPIQPTIRSGVHCRGCGIGLDPHWRFCPVCGGQNMGH